MGNAQREFRYHCLVPVTPVIQEYFPLAPLTTLGIGGPARYFVEARGDEDVLFAAQWAEQAGVALFVLGGGSNIVVSDDGFPGQVLKIALRGVSRQNGGGHVTFTGAAGEEWDGFVQRAVAQDLAGLECLSGIPGTVGGTPIQNVGAYGQEVSETIASVRALDRTTGCIVTLSNTDCGFSYRRSAFNTSERDRYVVLAVSFNLRLNGEPSLKYAELEKEFAGPGTPALAAVREAVLRIRARKAMVIVPGDQDCRSAGSFFKNPIVSPEQFQRIAGAAHRPVPHYPVPGSDSLKLAAAWLIEQAGFHKGYSRGRVGISSRHTLVLINRGGASARELLGLMQEVQRGVKGSFGIELHPEPLFIGFDSKSG